MVTGFNVDIRHGGKVFHVQTEDRGRRNPIVETLVYQGGKILHQERVSYADRNTDETYDEAAITRMVDMQHKRIIDSIKSGAFDADRKPFGEQFITDRSFDECVLEYLIGEAQNESLSLAVASQSELRPGEPAWVVVRASHRSSSAPIAGALLKARVIRSEGGTDNLADVRTDERGEGRLEFAVPPGDGHAALIVQAESDAGRDEIQKLLR